MSMILRRKLKLLKRRSNALKKAEKEKDKALGEISSLALTSANDEVEKKALELQTVSSQLGESQRKVEALDTS